MSSTIWRSSRPVVSPRRMHARARHQIVGLAYTVAVHHEWAAGRRNIVAACCEWPANRCCPVVVLQTPFPHVLLAFNVSLAACLACVQYRPCHVMSWKIRTHPNGRS
jgi:hypothetical protein